MRLDDEEDKEGNGESGSGGGRGEIQFHWDMPDTLREDSLSPQELKRRKITKADIHKDLVDQGKVLRQQREALKQGKIHPANLEQSRFALGMGGGRGGSSPYKRHKVLGYKAQFQLIDEKMAVLPNQSKADTNDKLRNELENRNELRLTHAPKFNPKPRPY